MKVILSNLIDFERTWWRLFIPIFLTLSVPDEGYSFQSFWLWSYLMNVILSNLFDFECTWWMLFFPIFLTLSVPNEGYSFQSFWLWAYLMKVIPEKCRVHYIWYIRFYWNLNHINMKNEKILYKLSETIVANVNDDRITYTLFTLLNQIALL